MSYDLGVMHAGVDLDDSKFKNKLGGLQGLGNKVFQSLAAGMKFFLALFAVNKIKDFAVESVKAFAGQEEMERSLENAMKNSDVAIAKNRAELNKYYADLGYTKEKAAELAKTKFNLNLTKNIEDLKDFASEIQNLTVYGDESNMKIMSLGLNMGISSDQIKEATKAAIGLAERFEIDVNTAMRLVAKASNGQTEALRKHIPNIDTAKSKQEQFNQVLKEGAIGFELAKEKTDTINGRLKQLSNAWGDLQEEIGGFLAKLFGVKDAAKSATDWIVNLTNIIKTKSLQWVYNIKKMYYEVEAVLRKIWAVIEPVVTLIWEGISAGIKNIVNLSIWLCDNWSVIWNNMGKILYAVLQDVMQNIDNVFHILGTIITSSFSFWGDVLKSFLVNWKSIAMDMFEIWKRMWKMSFTISRLFLENMAKGAASFGTNLWDLITGKKTFSEAVGGVFDDASKVIENTLTEIGKDWEGFEFGKGTKQFGKDVAKAQADHLARIGDAALKYVTDYGKNTERVLQEIGTTPLPKLEQPDYQALIRKYLEMSKTLEGIDKDKAKKQKALDEWLRNELNKKNQKDKHKSDALGVEAINEASKKEQSVMGAFSAAILAGMIGAQSPAERTATATEKMQKDISRMKKSKLVYAG